MNLRLGSRSIMIRAGTCPPLLHRLTGTQSRLHNQAVARLRLLSPRTPITSHRTRDTGTEAGTRISPGCRGMLRLVKMRTHMRISAGSSFGSSSSPDGADTGLITASLLQLQKLPSPRREFQRYETSDTMSACRGFAKGLDTATALLTFTTTGRPYLGGFPVRSLMTW